MCAWATLCSNEVWAPEPSSEGETQPCHNAAVLGTDYIDFPRTEAHKNLSFVLISTPAALGRRVEDAIEKHAGNVTETVGSDTSHIVILAPHPIAPSDGISWGAAQSHLKIKAAYAERKARKAHTAAPDKSKLREVYFVHPGFLIESMRRGAHVADDKIDLKKVMSPQVWNWHNQ